MAVSKQEAQSFIYKLKVCAIKLKYLIFCAETTAENLGYAAKRHELYDNAVVFYSAIYQWLNDGIISPENAFNCAFEYNQKTMGG